MSAKFEDKVVLVAGGTLDWARRDPGVLRKAPVVVYYRAQAEFRCFEKVRRGQTDRDWKTAVDVTDEAAVRQ